MPTNFIFGDSLSYGLNNTKSWVQLLREFNNNEIYYNLSINGETTSYLLKRLEFELIQRLNNYDKNRIFLFIGINDSRIVNGKEENSIDNFKDNYIELINVLRKYINEIILIGLTPVNEEIMKNYVEDYNNDRIKLFDNVIKNIAIKENLKYIPLFDNLDSNFNVLSNDGIHLSEKGVKIIFEEIVSIF